MLQVIDWAQRQAGDRLTYAVALVRDDADRERLPVGIPTGDTMPPGVPDPFNDGTQQRPQV